MIIKQPIEGRFPCFQILGNTYVVHVIIKQNIAKVLKAFLWAFKMFIFIGKAS